MEFLVYFLLAVGCFFVFWEFILNPLFAITEIPKELEKIRKLIDNLTEEIKKGKS